MRQKAARPRQENHLPSAPPSRTAQNRKTVSSLPGRHDGFLTTKRDRRQETVAFTLTDGATPALDASKAGSDLTPGVFILTAAGDRTIAVPTNPKPWQRIFIIHRASAGARTLALNTGAGGFVFGTDITTLTITAGGRYDIIGCQYNPTLALWMVISYVKGFA